MDELGVRAPKKIGHELLHARKAGMSNFPSLAWLFRMGKIEHRKSLSNVWGKPCLLLPCSVQPRASGTLAL